MNKFIKELTKEWKEYKEWVKKKNNRLEKLANKKDSFLDMDYEIVTMEGFMDYLAQKD